MRAERTATLDGVRIHALKEILYVVVSVVKTYVHKIGPQLGHGRPSQQLQSAALGELLPVIISRTYCVETEPRSEACQRVARTIIPCRLLVLGLIYQSASIYVRVRQMRVHYRVASLSH